MGTTESKSLEELLKSDDPSERDQGCEEIWASVVQKDGYQKLNVDNLEITNLVFEGGGTKGIGYCGALKVLDDMGILKNVKRFAGTSAGAYFAMRLCLGDTLNQILLTNLGDFRDILYDSGNLRFLINVLRKFGWHRGKTLLRTLRADVERATGSPDTTFYQWYTKTKRELCVPIVNLSTGSLEYCHPKTTPDMHIAEAVRISMSLPIVFQPFLHHDQDGVHYLCDGGLLDNYPIAAFDGWYLSMEQEDSFFHKMGSSKDPFGGAMNQRTLGMLLFNADEDEHCQQLYKKRYGKELVGTRPKTKLAKERAKRYDRIAERKEKKANATESSHFFLKKLSEFDKDKSGDISKDEFVATMDTMFTDSGMRKHILNIFGTLDLDLDAMFEEADLDKNGTLSFVECLHLLQRAGTSIRQLMTSSFPVEIHGMGGFVNSIFSALDIKLRNLTLKPEDADRSIGIYMDYIGTTDFEMVIEDKIYGIKQGWKAAVAYLKVAGNK